MDDLDHLLRELAQPEGPITSHRHMSSDSLSSSVIPGAPSSLSPSSTSHLSSQPDMLPTPDQVLPPGLLALWNASALPSSPSSFLTPEGRQERRTSLQWSLIHALLLFTALVYWILPRSPSPSTASNDPNVDPKPTTPYTVSPLSTCLCMISYLHSPLSHSAPLPSPSCLLIACLLVLCSSSNWPPITPLSSISSGKSYYCLQ